LPLVGGLIVAPASSTLALPSRLLQQGRQLAFQPLVLLRPPGACFRPGRPGRATRASRPSATRVMVPTALPTMLGIRCKGRWASLAVAASSSWALAAEAASLFSPSTGPAKVLTTDSSASALLSSFAADPRWRPWLPGQRRRPFSPRCAWRSVSSSFRERIDWTVSAMPWKAGWTTGTRAVSSCRLRLKPERRVVISASGGAQARLAWLAARFRALVGRRRRCRPRARRLRYSRGGKKKVSRDTGRQGRGRAMSTTPRRPRGWKRGPWSCAARPSRNDRSVPISRSPGRGRPAPDGRAIGVGVPPEALLALLPQDAHAVGQPE